jgi:hypothetical protein
MSEKVILIDNAGWGDLILGVVVGALNLDLPDARYMERRIPILSFQPPNFEKKKYLDDAIKIAHRIVKVMQPDAETKIKIRSRYVLSSMSRYLREQGFMVEEVDITDQLQKKVERGYMRWCKEMGAPTERVENRERSRKTPRSGRNS